MTEKETKTKAKKTAKVNTENPQPATTEVQQQAKAKGKSAYAYIQETFQKEYSGKDKELFKLYKQKLINWRREEVTTKLERPTNPARARSLGYKAKKGFVIVRIKIRKGGRRKSRPNKGRKPSSLGVNKFTTSKSTQMIAEERVARKHMNLEVLNSYWVGADGQHSWYEIILVDPRQPEIMHDKRINWIMNQRKRVHRGLTSVGKRSRGMR